MNKSSNLSYLGVGDFTNRWATHFSLKSIALVENTGSRYGTLHGVDGCEKIEIIAHKYTIIP
jgi:hypothetical protein